MKLNEAPEKVFIRPRAFIGPWPPYIDENSKYGGIEYTRTDAFIEKACSWLKSKCGFTIGFLGAEIKDFKNYMKGEYL